MAKILIVRLGAMGDILHALPVATAIRAALPGDTIGWLVEEVWSELLTAQGRKASPSGISPQKPVVNNIHTVDTRRWRKQFFRPSATTEILGALKRVRKIDYDFALDFQGAIKSGLFARIGGASMIAGFEDPRESGARMFYGKKFPRHGEHVIEQNHALAVQALQPVLGSRELKLCAPLLPIDPMAEAWADAEIARLGIASFAIVNPGAGWGAKQWPPQRFGEVAKALAAHNIKTLVNASADEAELARIVVEASGGNAFTYAPPLDNSSRLRAVRASLLAVTQGRCIWLLLCKFPWSRSMGQRIRRVPGHTAQQLLHCAILKAKRPFLIIVKPRLVC